MQKNTIQTKLNKNRVCDLPQVASETKINKLFYDCRRRRRRRRRRFCRYFALDWFRRQSHSQKQTNLFHLPISFGENLLFCKFFLQIFSSALGIISNRIARISLY